MQIRFGERKERDHAAIACRASVLVEDPDLDGLVIEDVVIWFPKGDDDVPGVSFPSREYTNREGEKKRFEFIRAKDEQSIKSIKAAIGNLAARWLSKNAPAPPRPAPAKDAWGPKGSWSKPNREEPPF